VVSKSNGNVPDAQQVWQVVWERRVTATNGDIRGARLTWDGVIASSSFPIVSTADDDLFPTVTSATEMDQSYLVAWQRIPAGPLPSDLMGQVLRGNATVTAVVNLSQLLGLTTNGSEVHPSADSDGCRFAVAYTRTVAPFSETDVATFHLSGGATLGVTDGPAGKHVTSFADANVQIASTRSGGTEWFRYFPVSQSVEMGIAIINGGAYDGRRAGTILTTVPTGCGGLGIATNPSPALGQTFNTSVIGLVGAPVFVLGLPQSPLALCPGCSLGVSLAGALILGAPQFTTVIPCDGVLLGITIAVQFGDYPAPSGCPITGGNVRVTDTVNVTIR
jgi:hypothetical protein